MKNQDPDGGFNPMGMMKKMMGQMQDGGMMPMQMCRMMTESVTRTAEMATWATPELRALFDDWAGQVKEELLTKLAEHGGEVDLPAIAGQLQLSPDSVAFLLVGLAREGRVRLRVSTAEGEGE
ncbi:MAG: MarR family transcriptional regulator [Acidobacteria bacterium]|nr:MarR family transcriptional regulator [Acidobacteriota bacterium]